ncbi:MAG: flippase-like domain-containing protein [Spirochaetes bacterium]|nr:flippase-like domain-containing protein [Spirochaetota bacterium]
MKKTEKKNSKRKISIALSLLFSFAIIFIILKFTIDKDTFTLLSQEKIQYKFFIAAVCLSILYWVIWAVRLKILSSALDNKINISLWEHIKIITASLFIAGITPSSAGGEPIRIHLLHKNGMSTGGATAAVMTERLLDAIFILVCVPFAFFVYKDLIEVNAVKIGLYLGIAFFIALILIFIYAIKNPQKLKVFLIFIAKKAHRFIPTTKWKKETHLIEKITNEVDNFHQSMLFFRKERKKEFFTGGIVTILFWSTGFLVPSMLLLGMGLKPFILESYCAQVLLVICILIPTTPGSSGVAEASTAFLYAPLINQSLLGIFILLFRFITFHLNLLVGGLFLYKIFK